MTLQELIINREAGFVKLKEFMDQYLPLYSRQDQVDLKRDLIPSYLDIFENEVPNAFFASILSHCDLLPDDFNDYLQFFNTLKELPGLNDVSALHKKTFTKETNIDSYDLLVGTFPCQSTESIIRKACREEKSMSIIPCGCVHQIDGKTFSCTMEYIHYIYRILDREKSSEFIFYPDIINSLREPVPILSLVRR